MKKPSPPPDPKPDRTVPEVMLEWTRSPKKRRQKIATEYWDNYESGRPTDPEDY